MTPAHPHGEIRHNEDGTLDEVVASDVRFFHLEDMGGHWWMRLDLADGGSITVNIGSASGRANLVAMAERDL